MMNFLDNNVYCNFLRTVKAAFLELEKAMFTVATLVLMFTIITPVLIFKVNNQNHFMLSVT